MRSIALAFALLTICAPGRVEAQGSPLRALAGDTAELSADVGESYRRLMALGARVFGEGLGARVTIAQASEVDPFYRLMHVGYALDGEPLMSRAGGDVREPFVVYEGILGPGDHTLSVVLRYVGDGHRVVGYLPGYRFTMRSAYTFTVPTEGHVDLRVRPYTRGPLVPYADRLAIEYEQGASDD